MHHRFKQRRSARIWLALIGVALLCLMSISVRLWQQVLQDRRDYALMTAIQQGASAKVGLLLHQGADPNTRRREAPPHTWPAIWRLFLHPAAPALADTALMVAVDQGDLTILRSLLAAGAKPNVLNAVGDTALKQAVTKRQAEMVFALLERGANPNLSKSETSLLEDAVSSFEDATCCKVLECLAAHGADVRTCRNVATAIMLGKQESAAFLITHGADLKPGAARWMSPLYRAASSYDDMREIPKLLLQRGVDTSPDHYEGWDVLLWSAARGEDVLIQEAIRYGAQVNRQDKYGRTALMYAAAHNRPTTVRLLLEKGADVNAQDRVGWTALAFAAQTDSLAVTDLLLRYGADRRLRDREDHWTAEQRAGEVGQEEVAMLLHTWRRDRPGNAAAQASFAEGAGALATPEEQARVDSHHWIKSLPPGKDEDDNKYKLVVADPTGRQGKPFIVETRGKFWPSPSLQVFHDTDGSPYAFILSNTTWKMNLIVAIRGRRLVQVAEHYSTDFSLQPLPAGGILICGFEPTHTEDRKLQEEVPVAHQDDRMAHVYRFRNGKLTFLGSIFVPTNDAKEAWDYSPG